MSFRDQLQTVWAGLSNGEAINLRDCMVYVAEQIETKRELLSKGFKTLIQDTTDEGFSADQLPAMLQQIAKATLPDDEQLQLCEDLEDALARDASINETIGIITSRDPAFKKALLQLLEAAKDDKKTLSAVAGGTFKSTWQKNPNRTTKQKRRAITADALEVVAGLAIINRTGYSIQKSNLARKLANKDFIKHALANNDKVVIPFDNSRIDNHSIFKNATGLTINRGGIFGPSIKINFSNKADRVISELRQFTPLHQPYEIIRHKLGIGNPNANNNTPKEDVRDSISSHSSNSAELISEAEDLERSIDPRRLEHELAGNNSFDDLLQAVRGPSKSHPALPRSWSSIVSDLPSIDDKAGLTDLARSEIATIGDDVEQSVVNEIEAGVQFEENAFEEA